LVSLRRELKPASEPQGDSSSASGGSEFNLTSNLSFCQPQVSFIPLNPVVPKHLNSVPSSSMGEGQGEGDSASSLVPIDRERTEIHKNKGARLRRAPFYSSYRFSFIPEHYGIRRVLTIRTMTAMTRIAPTAMTAHSK
jgi:hypothetical protein